MVSIFIMYSNDRKAQLEMVFKCLAAMSGFEACQKTLVVDGRLLDHFPGWDVIQVPRVNGRFCWANMWNAGVATARHPVIWYLDSDRLLPSYYLDLITSQVKDDVFAFTSWHHNVQPGTSFDLCVEFLNEDPDLTNFQKDRYLAKIWYEPRFRLPTNSPGKNVMSGNTTFTKATFLKLGGVDPWYCGHGAFADTDFHVQAAKAGCEFMDLMVPEVHYHHVKLSEGGTPHLQKDIALQTLDNYIYYCRKWGVSMAMAESMAAKIKIPKPRDYIMNRIEYLSNKDCLSA